MSRFPKGSLEHKKILAYIQSPAGATTTNRGQGIRKDSVGEGLKEKTPELILLGVVNPQNPVPFNLTSKGLIFLLETGEQVNVYTEDLENFLISLIGNNMNNRDDSKYAFSLGTSKSFFPPHFLK